MSSTVPQRGRIIYDWLEANPGRKTRAEWLTGTGLPDDAKTNNGLKYARGIAVANNKFIPNADAANGFTYILTDQPSEAVDAELVTSLQARGMERWHEEHLDFMAQHNFAGLTDSEKKFAKARIKRMHARRAEAEADAEMTSAFIAMRREIRGRDGEPTT
jgi:hypothetical protein